MAYKLTFQVVFSKRSLTVTKGRRRMCEDIYRIVAITQKQTRGCLIGQGKTAPSWHGYLSFQSWISRYSVILRSGMTKY
jgi:hypothetical protein